VTGGPKDMSAYRGEVTGILATIQLVSSLCAYHGILDRGIPLNATERLLFLVPFLVRVKEKW
jgi:hypothetical protein